jgi:DNA-binding PadR family transcriptional regulator
MVETIQSQQPKHPEPMEVFLMAAISRGGLATLYALQQEAGLQPGNINPLLRDLEEAGLLERSEVPSRGRRRRTMALTEAGEKFLAERWTNCLDPNREIESILRSVTVALLMNDARTAFNFLRDSASERERHRGPKELGPASLERNPIDFHAEMRAVYASRRRAMEAAVLTEFARNLLKPAEINMKSGTVDHQD